MPWAAPPFSLPLLYARRPGKMPRSLETDTCSFRKTARFHPYLHLYSSPSHPSRHGRLGSLPRHPGICFRLDVPAAHTHSLRIYHRLRSSPGLFAFSRRSPSIQSSLNIPDTQNPKRQIGKPSPLQSYAYLFLPQHFLYFLPLPQGHGSLG